MGQLQYIKEIIMTKVLHIVGCLEKGGTEAFIMNNYRKLYELGYIFDFYVVFLPVL